MSLADTGKLSYGGFEFDALYATRMNGGVEYDRAKRKPKYLKLVLEVDALVTADGYFPNSTAPVTGIATVMDDILEKLTSPGGELLYEGKGFGGRGLHVNGASPVKDVVWGPKPTLVTFQPLGSSLSANVTWRVETCIPYCRDSAFYNVLLAFNWTASLGFQSDRYMTYAIKGELEIAQPASGPRVDLEQFRPLTEPPLGSLLFQPTRTEFNYNDDKRILTFDYAYDELAPGGLPTNCSKASGRYAVRSSSDAVVLNAKWIGSLAATYTVRPDAPRREAFYRFLSLYDSVMRRWDRNTGLFNRRFSGPLTPALQVIREFDFETGLYQDSKTSSFSMSWMFVSYLQDILAASSIWTKVADADPALWQASMADINGYTNWGGYALFPSADVLVDACDRIGPPNEADKELSLLNRERTITNLRLRRDAANLRGLSTGTTIKQNPLLNGAMMRDDFLDPDNGQTPETRFVMAAIPDPRASWLEYENTLIVDLDTGMVVHKSLPQENYDVDDLGTVDAYATSMPAYKSPTGGMNTISESGQSDFAQRAATSTFTIKLRGYAKRAGYQVPVPKLVSFGGVTPTLLRQRVTSPEPVANYSGIPIFARAWEMTYQLTAPPTSQQLAPQNPAQRIAANTKPTRVMAPVSVPETERTTGTILTAFTNPTLRAAGVHLPTGILPTGIVR